MLTYMYAICLYRYSYQQQNDSKKRKELYVKVQHLTGNYNSGVFFMSKRQYIFFFVKRAIERKKPKCKLRGINFWTVMRGLGHIFVINYHNLTNKTFVKYFDYNWLSKPIKMAENQCQTWLEGRKIGVKSR